MAHGSDAGSGGGTTPRRPRERFHGRARTAASGTCAHPGCPEPGEFRAPRSARPEQDGYDWLCLEHVRAFNAGYDYFKGLTPQERAAAERGHDPGWARATRRFARNGSGAHVNLDDPLGVFAAQPGFARYAAPGQSTTGARLTASDLRALRILGLDESARWSHIKARYKELVLRYHPDRNGGDRSHESRLRDIIDAFRHLRSSAAFR